MSRLAIVIGLGIVGFLGGCVEREMTITSEPAGALVFVSDTEVGRTPVTIPFTWYGDYDIILRRDEYKTLKTHAHINVPIHQIPPIDFFTSIAPWTIRDYRYLHFKMNKLSPSTDVELIERADILSKRNLEPVAR